MLASFGEPVNDGVNKRERVAAVLAEGGLSAQASNLAMLSAHKTGRGVIAFFDSAEEAEALRQRLVAIAKRSQAAWLADGAAEGDGPGVGRWAQDLIFETEPCSFYRQPQSSDEDAGRRQLEA